MGGVPYARDSAGRAKRSGTRDGDCPRVGLEWAARLAQTSRSVLPAQALHSGMLEAHRPLYDLLFGDVPMHAWGARVEDHEAGAKDGGEVWRAFRVGREAWHEGEHERAISAWQRVLTMTDVEARQHAQAWCYLRGAGVMPEGEEARRLLGVVMEVPVEAGLDVLACYTDHSAYYLNHAGPAIIWTRPSGALDEPIDRVLDLARGVVARTGVWDKERLTPAGEPPFGGAARVSMLTPAGLHFGQAPADVLFADAMAGPLLGAGAALMQAMMGLEKERGQGS